MASGWDAGGTVIRNNGRNTGTDIWAVDAAAAQPIDAAGHDTHDQGLADSIADCLHIGGYNAMTADLDMNTNDILSAANIQASGDIVFTERADHASTPGAGKGYLWVRSDAPSSLIFTDDAGTDYDLTNITSVGTLPNLQVDNININGNTISSTAGTDLNITPLAGQQIVLDGTIVIDAGVMTGATSITSTAFVGTLSTAAQPNVTSLGTLTTLTVDNININGAAITSSTGAISFDNENLTTTGSMTCGTFTSTGIDDNATTECLEIADSLLKVGTTGAFEISRNIDTSRLQLSGGTAGGNCASINLYGGNFGAASGIITFTSSAANVGSYDPQVPAWRFFQDVSVEADLDVTGTATIATLKTGTHSAIGAETVTGYITIVDAGGTSRKLAVVS